MRKIKYHSYIITYKNSEDLKKSKFIRLVKVKIHSLYSIIYDYNTITFNIESKINCILIYNFYI